eukprot:gene17740-21133_t
MAARTLLGLLLFLLYSRELECATVSNPLSGDDNGLQSHHLTGYSQQEFIANGTAQAGTAMIIYPFKVTLLDPEDDKHNAEGSQIIWILSVGVSLHSFIAALIVYLRWRKHNISLREEAREQGRQDPNTSVDLMEFDSACQHHIMTALGMMGPAPDAAPASWESEAAVREPSIAAESEVGTQAAGIVGNPVERTGSTTAEDIREATDEGLLNYWRK